MFLSNLRTKTFRGLKAAVLAGRLAGGKAYGYRKVVGIDSKGREVNGVFEIDPEQAEIVRRIYREFADGKSPNDIAIGLNRDQIPSPRGNEWGPSTISADSDEAAPRFRDDCAPSFRDDVAPPETGPCWLRLLLFRSFRSSSL